jgi:hypothetical protein
MLLAGYIGRPLQRMRARRLARRGKVRSVLFSPSNPRVLKTIVLDGAAEVGVGGANQALGSRPLGSGC